MNHEILFRGKRMDNDEWTYGYVFDDGVTDSKRVFVGGLVITDTHGKTDDRFDVGIDFYEVDPETRGQYTEFTDKNNKKIFEDDIIEVLEEYFVVKIGEYIDFNTAVYMRHYGVYIERIGKPGTFGLPNHIVFLPTIIGNIHDNPELLENKLEVEK